ncbi:MAG: glycosyltransferase family 9 protein [Planctomycetota bacterium]|jgi:lipopolysaccharide heptosyltransferase II
MKRVLVINLGGIGDLLLSVPALKALRSSYPEAEISILAPAGVHSIVQSLFFIDRVFTFNLEYGGIVPLRKVLRNLKILLILRKKQFDVAINMRTLYSEKGAKKIKFLLEFIKPKVKVGRDTEAWGNFFDVKIPETRVGQKYEMEYDIDTVRALGAEVKDRSIDFNIDVESFSSVERILEKEGLSKGDTLIGVHPGGMPSRAWPVENFAKVIEDINRRISCRFVITGGRDEVNLAKHLTVITDAKVANLAGKLNTAELGALIKRCNVFIANDTGPMHIAAILKTPLVAIFGPGDITRFDPRNISQKATVLHKKVECAPCEKTECRTMKCLKIIHPEEVVEAALGLVSCYSSGS